MPLSILNHERGPRVYVAGKRVHHGSAGLAAAAVLRFTRHERLSYLALALAAHDYRDFPFRDCDNH